MCVLCKGGAVAPYVLRKSFMFTYVAHSKFPVSELGHILVIPKRHHEKLSSMRWWELIEMFAVLIWVYARVSRIHPGPMNIQTNQGEEAGQTVDHVHWHVILRKKGDHIVNMHNPEGKREVPKEVVSEWRERLR